MNKFFPLEFKKENILYFYIPCLLLAGWLFLTFISIFSTVYKNLNNFFVVLSIIIRLGVIITGIYFINEIFIKRNKDKKKYNYFRAYVGYGVVFTYVFYSL